jgi:hypothetical protein
MNFLETRRVDVSHAALSMESRTQIIKAVGSPQEIRGERSGGTCGLPFPLNSNLTHPSPLLIPTEGRDLQCALPPSQISPSKPSRLDHLSRNKITTLNPVSQPSYIQEN